MSREYYSEETRKKYKEIVLDYIKEHPETNTTEIRKELGMKVEKIFEEGIEQAYEEARVPCPVRSLKRSKEEKIVESLEFIKSNPQCTVEDFIYSLGILPAKLFGSLKNAYDLAGEEYPRRTIPSIINSEIRKRAYNFETEVLALLEVRGEVTRYYKTSVGITDALFEMHGKKFVVEIKDYQKKPITMHELKQLYKYIRSVKGCSDGILITHKSTKRPQSNIYIDGHRISIIAKEDLLKLPL